MNKKNLKIFAALNKIHEQEAKFKKELAKTYLEYLDALPTNKRIEQIESVLYETYRNLPTHDRRLTPQEIKCLFLASKGKEIKEMASILGLSQRTIKYHRANITKKLEVPNLMAAVALRTQSNNIINCEISEIISWKSFLTNMLLVNLLPVSIFWKDREGKYLGCNDLFAHSIGLPSSAAVIGKTDYDLPVKKKNSDAYRRDDKEIMESRIPKLNIEEEQTFSGGRKAYLLTNKVPMFGKNNETLGVLGIYNDITALKTAKSQCKSKEIT